MGKRRHARESGRSWLSLQMAVRICRPAAMKRLAHRPLLAYLVKALREAIPVEAEPGAIDATATILHNSVRQMLSNLSSDVADRIEALVKDEIDMILTAPTRDHPPQP